MQIKKSLVILGLAVLFLVPFASAGFFDFLTGKVTVYNTNVTANVISTQATVITSVRLNQSLFIPENNTATVVVNFTASDLDGSNDINLTSGYVNIYNNFCAAGPKARNSTTTCVNVTPSGLGVFDVNFTCQVVFQYYDCAGSNWIVNASILFDHTPFLASNSSLNLTIAGNTAIAVSPLQVAFPDLSVGFGYNSTTDNNITNLGNLVPNIKLAAYNLVGESNSSFTFNSANFSAESLNGTHLSTTNFCIDGNVLTNGTNQYVGKKAPAAIGDRPFLNADTPNPGRITEVKYCIGTVPQLPAQNYSTAPPSQQWVISAIEGADN